MRLVVAALWVVCPLYAQVCAPARILPAGQVTGSLGNSSCRLSDGSAYDAWRLDLPSRGQMQFDLTAGPGLGVILRDESGTAIASGSSIHRPLEAGSYTVLINAASADQTGSYSLQTAFTPEPGMMCSRFPLLGLNQTASGTLGASGCSAPDGTPYEAYTLHTFGSGTLTVAVNSADFTASLMVRDEVGHLLSSGPGQVSLAVDSDSLYQVVVSTADTNGNFILTTTFQPGDGETCRLMKSFSDSDSDSTSITADSCSTTIAGSADLAYFNYYTFTVTAPGVMDITSTSSDFLPMLYLLDEAGNVLAVDSGGGSADGQSEIRTTLNPGTYVAQVFSTIASGGAYTLSYQITPGSPQPCNAGTLNLGDQPAGSLSAARCRCGLGVADLFTATLPAAGTLDLNLTAPGFTGTVAVRDSKDNLLVSNQDVEGLGVTHLSADLPAGTYTIVAAANSGAGSYQLATNFSAHDLPPCSYIQPLDTNGGFVQRLRPGNCADSDGQPVDWYEFTLPSDSVVLAVMTSSDIDGLLRLTDTNGNVLRTDHDSYSPNDPMVVQYLSAGTYRLAARALGSSVGGYYEVDLRTTAGPRPPFCAPKGKLAPGAAIDSILGYAGCQYTDATFADIYQMDIPGSTTVDLRLLSGDFDAYLVVLDAKGNVVDEDDDSGGGTDARINRTFDAGTYYVVAKPLSDYYHLGTYRLILGQ